MIENRIVADAKAWFSVYRGNDAFERKESSLLYVSEPRKNLIVTNGKQLVLDRLFGLSSAVALSAIGVGTDSTAAAVGQSQLNPSVAGTVLIQAADAGTARSGTTVTITSTFSTSAANFTWNECGIFNGTVNTSSTLFDRIVIGPFQKSSSVSIVLSFQISQS